MLSMLLMHAGCATSAIDVAPLAKYQTLQPGTSVTVVTYLGDKKVEDTGVVTEMQKDHLVIWSETAVDGGMSLLYPGRMVREIKVLPKEPDQLPVPMAGRRPAMAHR